LSPKEQLAKAIMDKETLGCHAPYTTGRTGNSEMCSPIDEKIDALETDILSQMSQGRGR